jgi:hypothetical protein
MLPESVTLEEAVERLYQAFKLKQAHSALTGTAPSGPAQAGSRQPTMEIALGLLATTIRLSAVSETLPLPPGLLDSPSIAGNVARPCPLSSFKMFSASMCCARPWTLCGLGVSLSASPSTARFLGAGTCRSWTAGSFARRPRPPRVT